MSSPYPKDRKYTKEHEWALLEKNIAVVGITWYAQSKLKDIVYIELPKVGKKVKKGDVLAVVESVKTASDVYSPLSGEVIEVNVKLERNPELINKDPYGEGWIAKIKIENVDEIKELLSAEEYEKLVS
ncbi:MAG: glycine cleavage system protein GcvH [Thermoproteota archaeon]|jgi:glycine cleavage system H protein|nr:glycine cleavage system protein GcvH [Thermoproteota archaeon]